MNLQGLREGDLVQVNVKGRIFYARYLGKGELGRLKLEPICRNVTWRSCTAQDVIGVWHATAATRARGERQAVPS